MKKINNILLAIVLVGILAITATQPLGDETRLQITINAVMYLLIVPAWATAFAKNNPELSNWLRR